MVKDSALRIFWLRLTYLLIALSLILLQTLPIHTSQYQFIKPDFLLIITYAWIMRRPDVMGPILITIAFLFTDFILQRPPGLWTLITLCGSMFLKMRVLDFKEVVFFYEWLLVAIVVTLNFILYHFALLLTFLPMHNLKLYILHAFLTLITYPIFIWIFKPILRYSIHNTLKK